MRGGILRGARCGVIWGATDRSGEPLGHSGSLSWRSPGSWTEPLVATLLLRNPTESRCWPSQRYSPSTGTHPTPVTRTAPHLSLPMPCLTRRVHPAEPSQADRVAEPCTTAEHKQVFMLPSNLRNRHVPRSPDRAFFFQHFL